MKRAPSAVDQVRYFDETNNARVTLNHIQKNGTCGSLVLSEFSIIQSNNTLQKREYPMYPLCTRYYGVDYCANHG